MKLAIVRRAEMNASSTRAPCSLPLIFTVDALNGQAKEKPAVPCQFEKTRTMVSTSNNSETMNQAARFMIRKIALSHRISKVVFDVMAAFSHSSF